MVLRVLSWNTTYTHGLCHFQQWCWKSLDLLFLNLLQIYKDFGVILCIRLHNAGIAMSFWGKQQWDKMISTSYLSYGSVPNLLSTPCSESHSNLKMRASVDFLREWASDLGSLSAGLNLNLSSAKWPSLFTVCRWKQTLTEKLKKKPCSSTDESQVRKHIHLTISVLEDVYDELYFNQQLWCWFWSWFCFKTTSTCTN